MSQNTVTIFQNVTIKKGKGRRPGTVTWRSTPKFYDWSESTQKNRVYGLTSYDSADDVFEIAQEISWDEKFTTCFINNALDGVTVTVHFVPFVMTIVMVGGITAMGINTAASLAALRGRLNIDFTTCP